jgi:hypothetical protein
MAVRGLRLRHKLVCACSLLAVGVSSPAGALAADAAVAADAQSSSGNSAEDIVVIGTRYISGIQPERDLDEQGIESYGQSTVDELLGELQNELGDDEPPLLVVNGDRVESLDDIGGLPVEALESAKVLPRGSAVKAGGSAGQRVVSLKLKSNLRSATVLVAPKIATDGDWHAERGEATLTYIHKDTRANLTLKARQESDLFESDRDIRQPDPSQPYALSGNVVGFGTDGEIDPLLSAAAGEIVTVAAVPDNASPSLLDFADNANQAAVTDLGEFRTLRPETHNYDLNGTFATRLAPWLTGNIGVRLSHATRRSYRGLPQALFLLSPTNASSPFSTTVAIAQYGTEPLSSRSDRTGGEASLALNGRFGDWTGFFTAKHSYYEDETETERSPSPSTIVIPDSVDAFGPDLFDLATLRTSRSEAKTANSIARLTFTGPLFNIPAGAAQATFEGGIARNRLDSESDTLVVDPSRKFRRTETYLRGAIDLPLTVHDGFGAAIGDLDVSGEYSRYHYSDAGNASNYQFGIVWEPRPILRLSADLEESSLPPIIQFLGNPIIVTSGIRTFDPLTGDTVDVTQITGGNPDLDVEKTTVRRLGAVVRPLGRLNFQLNAEYTDTKERNFVSSVPEASAAVMLAFPDRFLRDLNGVLTTVDLRPVNFDSHHEQRFRYGFSLNTNLRGKGPGARIGAPPDDDGGDDEATRDDTPKPTLRARPVSTRLSLTAAHSIVFKDEITIRSGLPAVDLLDGGAIGIAGGRVRHQVDVAGSISSGGTGLRVTANWRGKSTLNALDSGVPDRLFFSPVFNLSLRAFTDLQRFLPHTDWARRFRVSLNVQNLTNDRQEVRDSTGAVPLRYQPGYRDPLGRTIELEIRKAF